jgi:hypothetical protein
MAVKMWNVVFWSVILCTLVCGYQCFIGTPLSSGLKYLSYCIIQNIFH